MQEDRLLRSITVQHVEARLCRQLTVDESAALHATIDVMLQRSVMALVDEQQRLLRSAAQTELKYLSFLSHDLNNHLSGVAFTLECLRRDLRAAGRFADPEDSLGQAQRAVHDTVNGMRQMLEHEHRGPGVRLIRQDDVAGISARMTAFRAALHAAVGNLDDDVEQLKAAAADRLGRLVCRPD